MRDTVAILGAGSWGTALALYVARNGEAVRLWGHDPARVRELARLRENIAYLPGFPIPGSVTFHDDPRAAIEHAGIIVLAVPSHHARTVLAACKDVFPPGAPLVIATKGIEVGSLMLMDAVAHETLGIDHERIAILSGPSFALEVARGMPTAIVVASRSAPLAAVLQGRLSSSTLRLYSSDDTAGVQIAGALKNVMAIAAGVLAGMGMGSNSVAALLTRGLAEMSRLGVAQGGRPSTFAGLAGLGDLILTGTSNQSRNRSFGVELGRGRSPGDVLAGMTMVAEGVKTAESAWSLALREGIELPIVEQVRGVLYDDVSPQEAIAGLMTRPLRSEGDR